MASKDLTFLELVDELKNSCFYGELLVKFEAGKIVFVRETRTRKVKEGEVLYQTK